MVLNNKKWLLLLLIVVIFIISYKIFNRKDESITIAHGLSENPDNPKTAIEINDNGNVYYYTKSPIDSISKFYHGNISKSEWNNIKNLFEGKNFIKNGRNRMINDATRYEININLNEYHEKIYAYRSQLPDRLIPLLNLQNKIHLSPIDNHSFSTNIQFEKLPSPPPIPSKQ